MPPILRLLLLLLALALPASAAAQPTLLTSAKTIRPGQPIGLLATVGTGERCLLLVDGLRTPLPTTDAGGMGIRGRITRRAAPGRHRLAVQCPSGRARARVTVVRTAANRGSRGRLLADGLTATLPTGGGVTAPAFELSQSALYALLARPSATPIPHAVVPASPRAEAWWAASKDDLVGVFRNGQCTDWVELKRPDVVQGAYQQRYDRYGAAGFDTSWDARHWTANATAAGMTVNQTPAEGAVMVFQPGTGGAGAPGHVAIVEHVGGDGSFAVSQMNAPNAGEVTVSAYGPQAAAQLRTDPGVAFIQ